MIPVVDSKYGQQLILSVGVSAVLGLNDPLRQYFSLYRAVSQNGRVKKCPNNPHPHLLQGQALALLKYKLTGRPSTGRFAQHHFASRPLRNLIRHHCGGYAM